METQVKILKPELFAQFDNEGFVHVKDLKKGDVIYECEIFDRTNNELIVITNPKKLKSGWICEVKNKTGDIEIIYVHKNCLDFPKLFRIPQFLEEYETGKFGYLIK